MTISLLLYLGAFLTCIASAVGKCPLWVSVMLVIVAGLLGLLPIH
jgi:hypothetical protein